MTKKLSLFIFLGVFVYSVISYVTISYCAEFELKLNDWNPPPTKISQTTQKMINMIEEKSGGRIKIRYFAAESLLKNPEVYRGVQSGAAEISYANTTLPGSPFDLNKITSLPFTGFTSMEMMSYVHQKLFDLFPEMRAEFKGLKVLGFRGMPLSHGHFVKKPVRSPDDLKGMKIITGGLLTDFLIHFGAAPVNLGAGDWYMSLERGLVQGHFVHFPATNALKTIDLFKYHLMIGSHLTPDCFIFNLNTWNSLPPDLQKIIEEAIQWRTVEFTNLDYGEEKKVIDYAKSKNQTFIDLTPEEIKAWQDAAKPIHDKTISDMEARGLPARKAFETMKRLIKEYEKEKR
jgi:TRAP-type C4-dicarboxylate transport system substrate-binding protein